MPIDSESLKLMFEMHIKECDKRDERNADSFKNIETMFKGIWDAHDAMRKIVTNLQIKLATGLGGLIVILKLLDYLGHK